MKVTIDAFCPVLNYTARFRLEAACYGQIIFVELSFSKNFMTHPAFLLSQHSHEIISSHLAYIIFKMKWKLYEFVQCLFPRMILYRVSLLLLLHYYHYITINIFYESFYVNLFIWKFLLETPLFQHWWRLSKMLEQWRLGKEYVNRWYYFN